MDLLTFKLHIQLLPQSLTQKLKKVPKKKAMSHCRKIFCPFGSSAIATSNNLHLKMSESLKHKNECGAITDYHTMALI